MSDNAFGSAENVAEATLVMSMRIYDALMALLKVADNSTARDLLELHAAGNILGPVPGFNGNFLTDLMKEDDGIPED